MFCDIEKKVLERDMKKQLPKTIDKNDLIDWFLGKQKKNKFYCHDITVKELVKSAATCGITVIRGEK